MIEVPWKPDISKDTPWEVVTRPTRKKAFNVLENKPINTFLDKLCTDQTLRPLLEKELKQYPLFCELLQWDLSKEKQKDLLEEALQKQQEATDHINTEKLDRIAEHMQTVILMFAKEDPRISDVIMQRDTDKTTPQEKKEIFQTIINRFSEKFQVTPPPIIYGGDHYFLTLNFKLYQNWFRTNEYRTAHAWIYALSSNTGEDIGSKTI